jgi:hypothetical protein
MTWGFALSGAVLANASAAVMAFDQEGNRLRAKRDVARIEMDMPSVRDRRIGQRQTPARKVAKTSGVGGQLDGAVDYFDVDRSAFDRCDNSDISAIARNRQGDFIHDLSMAR